MLFATFMAGTPSKKTGRPVKAKTIESYVSLIKGFLDFTYSFDLVLRAPRLKRLMADVQSKEPDIFGRKKRRGVAAAPSCAYVVGPGPRPRGRCGRGQ